MAILKSDVTILIRQTKTNKQKKNSYDLVQSWQCQAKAILTKIFKQTGVKEKAHVAL